MTGEEHPTSAGSRTTGRRRTVAFTAMAVVAVAAGAVLAGSAEGAADDGQHKVGHRAANAAATVPAGWFTLAGSDGAPVRFDPCAPVVVSVDPAAAAVPGLTDAVEQAVEVVGRASGLDLEMVAPGTNGAGDGTAEDVQTVRVAVVAPGETVGSPGGVAGEDGTTVVEWRSNASDGRVLRRSDLYVPTASATTVAASPGRVLHLLGHAVGLAERDDPTSVMGPKPHDLDGFSPSDLSALHQLGRRAGCADTLLPDGSTGMAVGREATLDTFTTKEDTP